ncbi:class I tRNA ligase family protein [Zeaxanthinibacter sp. PT1]|uniref:leucine--tRNA ligase n=1 Tax=Zeaxanthinibacter TaxID=561554 RepID=UPI00234A2B0D|nr:class I tRNA ligase family protein [Zeaxanthinibacter sp. PT1]MDC6351112.1 class I tRNA ligase family protein [Zeaxanthinibacter sp. PT1]
MSYTFREIEDKWQEYWAENQTFKADESRDKPKFYVLDMFPYPSGAGLHVGHPLGYIASDIYARYKRHKGFNVLHPMGYDSFGLPAEQYAIQTGQHPALTTEANIKRYREQLDKLGFSFDWSREVRTSDHKYYKWTQWVFIQLFNSWYDQEADKARPIEELIRHFEKYGNTTVNAACDEDTPAIDAQSWNAMSQKEQQQFLLKYRLTYLADTEVNWCPALGTVLANDEVINGLSERGGHPVMRKKMTQWSMRITAYAQRLLDGLQKIDWPQPLKDAQTNWIGRSVGAAVTFYTQPETGTGESYPIEVFTTRPDTIFGVSFMTLAPEHELVDKITTPAQREEVKAYVAAASKRSERERMADVKRITGVFTGAYAIHPFSKEPVPIWIGDYVLAGYGTGAVMSVPCGDQRDYDFAKEFNIPILNIFRDVDISEEAHADKENTVIDNSDFLNGLSYKEASKKAIAALEEMGQGQGKVNYRLRDAVFSRQRYWGEPFPVYYKDGLPYMLGEKHLPLRLPEVEKYLPTETGEPPLGNATDWAWNEEKAEVVSNEEIDHKSVFPLELNTMPGWAGSSQYFNRYMDPHNEEEIFSQEAINYWKDVDLYIGGMEHATGHLLYSRFWQKFMYDLGLVPQDEFARKLINQGMILGTSAFVCRWNMPGAKVPVIVSAGVVENIKKDDLSLKKISGKIQDLLGPMIVDADDDAAEEPHFTPLHADVSLVNSSDELDIEGFKAWRPEFNEAIFVKEDDGVFKVTREVEKMSKSKYNVVNPDAICEEYGADSLRMYEMFLGPLEQAKPWNTAGISGVHGFLKKLWRLYHSGPEDSFNISDEPASAEALKSLHKTIKKVEEDIENFSFNTTVSTFMICVNELSSQKCNAREILEPLAVLISPYAPHIAEELWEKLGHAESIATTAFPVFEEKYLVEQNKEYPISFNGKMRFTMQLPLDMDRKEIEAAVMANEKTKAQLDGKTPKKVIVVPGKIVNIVA